MAMNARTRKSTARTADDAQPTIDNFRSQHLALAQRQIATELGRASVTVDEAESPLVWLARRRGRDGRALIEPHHLQAGERLRADFARANLMPRTNSNWASPISSDRRGAGGDRSGAFTETTIASRQRVHHALDAVGPEFAGLLPDICCFLKGLEDIERERAWPARSAKIVLQLALQRLARHYGYAPQARGAARRRQSAPGLPMAQASASMEGNLQAAAASAALASARMRSTIERKPFERCGVRFSRRPMRSNSAMASVARISAAPLPE
jgi:hypothetical protein